MTMNTKKPVSGIQGLSWQKTTDAIAAFVKQYGKESPRRAVFCTYDFDPARFEAVLMPELNRRSKWFRTLVLADAAALQKTGVLQGRAASSTYELAPVRVNSTGVFHPKLILLQAGSHVLVGVGSGNLTVGGLGGNLELMLFSANEKSLAASAFQFLNDLRQSDTVTISPSAKRFLERICPSSGNISIGPILHNLKSPLIEQIKEGKPPSIERVAVMSPWHTAAASPDGVEPKVLAKIGEVLGKPITVYTQGQGTQAPDLGNGIDVKILQADSFNEDNDSGDEEDGESNAKPRRSSRLHAKAYLAVGKSKSTLWFGSANCTIPAICKVAGKEGNVEVLVQVALTKDSLTGVENDLNNLFKEPAGKFKPEKTQAIPAPKGRILAGYIEQWEGKSKFTLKLEIVPSNRDESICIAKQPEGGDKVPVEVPANKEIVTLNMQFLNDEEPVVLWEIVDKTAVPFPISISCAPETADAEMAIQDILDDLAGRAPLQFPRLSTRSRSIADDDKDSENDSELDLLTKSKHEGKLDRIAVRVEALRRCLDKTSVKETQLFKGIIAKLELSESLKKTLIDHLEKRGQSQ